MWSMLPCLAKWPPKSSSISLCPMITLRLLRPTTVFSAFFIKDWTFFLSFIGRCFSRSDHLALHMKRHLWMGEEVESCGRRDFKVKQPWKKGCVFQPKHAILHPNPVASRASLPWKAFRGLNKSCKKRHSDRLVWVHDVSVSLDSYAGTQPSAWLQSFLPWARALRMLMLGRLYVTEDLLGDCMLRHSFVFLFLVVVF